MKLLYVTAGLPFARGETFIIPEIAELCRRGHEVTVAPVRPHTGFRHADAMDLKAISVCERVWSLPVILGALAQVLRHPVRFIRAASILFASRSARLFLKNLAVLPKALWLARLARARQIEHIHAHWASTSSTAALVAARVANISWSLTAHRWDIAENNLIRQKAKSASFVRAIDHAGADELRAHMGGCERKLVVIHMGVTLPTFEPLVVEEHSSGPLRVIMAAFFVEKKGHRFAVDAVTLLAHRGVPVHLEFAGDGPIREDIEDCVARRGVGDRVSFLGMVGHDELLAGLSHRRWDVALLPSIVTPTGEREGIPVFLMEAMAAGLPVIATNTGGISELVDGAGMMLPPRDPQAIADALERLYHDRALRRALGTRARRKVAEEFTVAASVGRLVELLEKNGRGALSA